MLIPNAETMQVADILDFHTLPPATFRKRHPDWRNLAHGPRLRDTNYLKGGKQHAAAAEGLARGFAVSGFPLQKEAGAQGMCFGDTFFPA